MDIELGDWLRSQRQAYGEGPGLRTIDKAIALWNQGVIPSPKLLKEIQDLTPPRRICKRLEDDGSCVWLRRWGKQNGLDVPPPGERAMCPFVRTSRTQTVTYENCSGYRRG